MRYGYLDMPEGYTDIDPLHEQDESVTYESEAPDRETTMRDFMIDVFLDGPDSPLTHVSIKRYHVNLYCETGRREHFKPTYASLVRLAEIASKYGTHQSVFFNGWRVTRTTAR